jgi:O-antigen ligase
MNSASELEIGDYREASDINNKFRGWETYMAFVTFSDGNVSQIIFGHGLGKMIDLGTYLFFADAYRRYIPVLHNGYMYALVKTGIVGILCYLFYSIYIIRFAIKRLKLSDIKKSFQPLFLIGTLISIDISNIVTSSFYNPSFELLGIICGTFIYYLTNSDKAVLYNKKS